MDDDEYRRGDHGIDRRADWRPLQRRVPGYLDHPKLVQARLGHRQIGLTLVTYSHVTNAMDCKAADSIGKAFDKPKEPPAAAAGA